MTQPLRPQPATCSSIFCCLLAAVALAVILTPAPARAQAWDAPVRGAWVRDGDPRDGDVVLAEGGKPCQIIVADDAHSAVKQAAVFLAKDLQTLTGVAADAPVAAKPADGRVAIRLVTLG